jgi:hypothetical protein
MGGERAEEEGERKGGEERKRVHLGRDWRFFRLLTLIDTNACQEQEGAPGPWVWYILVGWIVIGVVLS